MSTPPATSHRERGAAAAGGLDVRVVELEARARQPLDVVDLGPDQVHQAHLVDDDLDAGDRELLAELGFRSYEVPGYGTDPDGNQHDMTLMVFKL